MPPSSEPPTAARVLRGGALLFGLIGLSVAIWLADKALRHPEIQASQFGFTAPLWIPALVFVVLATGAGIFVLMRAARRVEQGEDLFAQRHRRRASSQASPDEEESSS